MEDDRGLPPELAEPYRDDDFAVWVWMVPIIDASQVDDEEPDGAFVTCYVLARSKETALEKAKHWLLGDGRAALSPDPEDDVEFLACWRPGEEPEDDDDEDDDDEGHSVIQCVAEAWISGASLVFHTWGDQHDDDDGEDDEYDDDE